MNKYEELVRDFRKLQSDYENLIIRKRKVEKENKLLKLKIKIFIRKIKESNKKK